MCPGIVPTTEERASAALISIPGTVPTVIISTPGTVPGVLISPVGTVPGVSVWIVGTVPGIDVTTGKVVESARIDCGS